jgi:hypothetical protein
LVAVSLWGLALAVWLALVRQKAPSRSEVAALSLGLWLGAVSGLLFLLLALG